MKLTRFAGLLAAAALAAGVASLPHPHAPAYADGGAQGTGGAYNDPRYPPSAASNQVGALKDALLADQAAGRPTSQADLTALETLLDVSNATTPSGVPAHTLAQVVGALERRMGALNGTLNRLATSRAATEDAPSGAIQPQDQPTSCAGYNAGWCYASVLKPLTEPSGPVVNNDSTVPSGSDGGFYGNLCGPGSSTDLIWHWNNNPIYYNGSHGSGPVPYLLYLSAPGQPLPGGEMVDQGTKNSFGTEVYQTPYGNEQRSIDNAINSSYYSLTTSESYSSWVSHMDFDIGTSGVPMVIGASTNGLVNWGAVPNAIHLVSVDANNDPNDQFQYYDTAGSFSSGNSGTNGDHGLGRSAFAQYLTAEIW